MSKTLQMLVAITCIEFRKDVLRTLHEKDQNFINLCASVKKDGLLQPILLVQSTAADGATPKVDEDGNQMYTLVDGRHRLEACVRAGMTDIPANVMSISEGRFHAAQLVANSHTVETSKSEYSAQLQRILNLNPTMTQTELAQHITQTPEWVNNRLSLNKLSESAKKMVDSDEMPLANAYVLAKLPPEVQEEFVDSAVKEKTDVFTADVQKRAKEIRDSKRQGRDPNATPEFTPTPRYIKASEAKALLGEDLSAQALIAEVTAKGISSVEDAVRYAIQRLMGVDPESLAEAKEKFDKRNAERAAKRKAIAAERAAKRAEAAAKEAEKLKAELAAS